MDPPPCKILENKTDTVPEVGASKRRGDRVHGETARHYLIRIPQSAIADGTLPSSHPSGPPIADRDLVPLHDHRHTPLSLGVREHFVQLRGIYLYIKVFGSGTIGLTGLHGMGSAGLPVDRYFARHGQASFSRWSFPGHSDKIVSQLCQGKQMNSVYDDCRRNKTLALHV